MQIKAFTELLNLNGKAAIVTGGALGIGFGVAKRLAEAGANVVIADINSVAANDAVQRIASEGGKAISVLLDVSDKKSIDSAIAESIKAFGSVDILINNAGIYPSIPVLEIKESDIDKVIGVNLKGAMLMVQAAALQMIKQGNGGKIINITSIDAIHPSSVGLAIYDATKHGLWGFTKNIALELSAQKIWVNAIAPGGISTPGTGAGKPLDPQMVKVMNDFADKIPMKRMGEPDDIGKVALFLASDLSSYMTGSQVVVDGGFLLS